MSNETKNKTWSLILLLDKKQPKLEFAKRNSRVEKTNFPKTKKKTIEIDQLIAMENSNGGVIKIKVDPYLSGSRAAIEPNPRTETMKAKCRGKQRVFSKNPARKSQESRRLL